MKTVDQASCSHRVPQDSRSIRELSDFFFFFSVHVLPADLIRVFKSR